MMGNGNHETACSTPYGIRGLAPVGDSFMVAGGATTVLNALRHQRFGTIVSAMALGVQAMLRCSTPYGIRGLAPCCEFRHLKTPSVLNALRHQRFGTQGAMTLR